MIKLIRPPLLQARKGLLPSCLLVMPLRVPCGRFHTYTFFNCLSVIMDEVAASDQCAVLVVGFYRITTGKGGLEFGA